MLINDNCIWFMQNNLNDNEVMFSLTDIPYNAVNRSSNGLRNLDKEAADTITFDLDTFLQELLRVTKNSICIFCSKEQFSHIFNFFAQQKGTTRPIIWEKINPSPMNGQYIYLSGLEFAVWFKKSGAKVFNAHCKNTVFRYPNGKRTFHPTQKNLELFEELIKDNSNEGDLVFDPCMGSGTTAIASIKNKRRWLGCELSEEYYIKAGDRIRSSYDTTQEEIQVTKDWLNQLNISYQKVEKSSYANDEDIIVTMNNGQLLTVEVKQEELWRFSKWHEYGIDMISAFQFKKGHTWDTRVHKPEELQQFLDCIDQSVKGFKWGKIIYSKAHVWLFYTKNSNGTYYNLKGYDMVAMKNTVDLPKYIAEHCSFARNAKKKDDVSDDTFHSATFFALPKLLEPWLLN